MNRTIGHSDLHAALSDLRGQIATLEDNVAEFYLAGLQLGHHSIIVHLREWQTLIDNLIGTEQES